MEILLKLTKRVNEIELSSTIKLANKVRELCAKGERLINLSTGEPNLPTPENVKLAAIKAIKENKTKYSHSKGNPDLRKILCNRLNKKFGCKLDRDKNILITPGCKQAIFYLILSIIEEGDEVLIPIPSWVSYPEIVKLANGRPIYIECEEKNDFTLSFQKIKKAINKKTKAIIINNPNNPTGKIIRKDILKNIQQLCIEKDIFLICDEIYDKIIFKGNKFFSILSINPKLKNCAVINGFSKTYSMTGWRLGYVITSFELISAMNKIQQNSATCPVTFTQYGAIEALKNANDFVNKAIKIYEKNKNILLKEFKTLKNFRVIHPEGSIYLFIDISKISQDSNNFCLELLNKCKIVAVPGSAFGYNSKAYIRICLSTDKENIIEFVKKLRENYN